MWHPLFILSRWVFLNCIFWNHWCFNAASLLSSIITSYGHSIDSVFNVASLYNWTEWRWSRPGQSRGGDASESPQQAQSGSSWQETQTAASCEYCNYRLSSAFYTGNCKRGDWLSFPPMQHSPVSLIRYVKHACTASRSCFTFMHSHPLAAAAARADTHLIALINCHIWMCLIDVAKLLTAASFGGCLSSAFHVLHWDFLFFCLRAGIPPTQQSALKC